MEDVQFPIPSQKPSDLLGRGGEEVQFQPQVLGLDSSIFSLPFDESTCAFLSITLSSAFLRSSMADGSRQGMNWGSGIHMRTHGEQRKN